MRKRALHARLHQRHQVVGLVELARDHLALVVVGRARLGGRDAARAAVEQPRPQPRLQRRHVLGGGGLGDAEVDAGTAEAAGLDDADEEADAGDGVHGGNVAAGGGRRREAPAATISPLDEGSDAPPDGTDTRESPQKPFRAWDVKYARCYGTGATHAPAARTARGAVKPTSAPRRTKHLHQGIHMSIKAGIGWRSLTVIAALAGLAAGPAVAAGSSARQGQDEEQRLYRADWPTCRSRPTTAASRACRPRSRTRARRSTRIRRRWSATWLSWRRSRIRRWPASARSKKLYSYGYVFNGFAAELTADAGAEAGADARRAGGDEGRGAQLDTRRRRLPGPERPGGVWTRPA